MMKTFCPKCFSDVNTSITYRKETYPVKGDKIVIDAKVCLCPKCGEAIWVASVDEENIDKAYRAYQHKHKLLLPAQIKKIREEYQLSQSAFARLLGFGEKTITRYENGYIQDEGPNNLIYLVEDPAIFQVLYEKNKSKISKSEQYNVEQALDQLLGRYVTPYCSGSPYDFNGCTSTFMGMIGDNAS